MGAPKVAPFQVRWIKAMMRSQLDPTAKLVGCAIAAHMNRYGWAKPSKRTIAEFCSISVRAVDGAVNRLEEAGWITVKRSYGRNRNEYQGHLNPAGSCRVAKGGSQVPNPAADDMSTPQVAAHEVNQ